MDREYNPCHNDLCGWSAMYCHCPRICNGCPCDNCKDIPCQPTPTETPHGRWRKLKGDFEGSKFARCTACNGGNFNAPTDYCPNCGAKMEVQGE